jgi:hypothetical protein
VVRQIEIQIEARQIAVFLPSLPVCPRLLLGEA